MRAGELGISSLGMSYASNLDIGQRYNALAPTNKGNSIPSALNSD